MVFNLKSNFFDHLGQYCIDIAFIVHNHFTILVFNLGECVKNDNSSPIIFFIGCENAHLWIDELKVHVEIVEFNIIIFLIDIRIIVYFFI